LHVIVRSRLDHSYFSILYHWMEFAWLSVA
jgi:hypothetical protein